MNPSPTRYTGLKAETGLWKMAAIRFPRISRRRRSGAPTISSPSSRMLPSTVAPTCVASPRIAIAVIDLPDPDSPASPTISPAPRRSDSRSTARREPNMIRRPLSRSRASPKAAAGWLTEPPSAP